MNNKHLNDVISKLIREATEKLTTPYVKTNQGQAQYWTGYRRALTDLRIQLHEPSESNKA